MRLLASRVPWPFPDDGALTYYRDHALPAMERGLPWQRQGLMSEAVEVVTGYWFDQLGFRVLRSPKAVANTASRRISEKSGMRVVAVEESDCVSGRLPAEIWEITAEEWRRRRARAGSVILEDLAPGK